MSLDEWDIQMMERDRRLTGSKRGQRVRFPPPSEGRAERNGEVAPEKPSMEIDNALPSPLSLLSLALVETGRPSRPRRIRYQLDLRQQAAEVALSGSGWAGLGRARRKDEKLPDGWRREGWYS